jgi:hypothetical protein
MDLWSSVSYGALERCPAFLPLLLLLLLHTKAAAAATLMPKLARALPLLTLIAGRNLLLAPPLLAGTTFDLWLHRGALLLAVRAWRNVAAAAIAATLRCFCCCIAG